MMAVDEKKRALRSKLTGLLIAAVAIALFALAVYMRAGLQT